MNQRSGRLLQRHNRLLLTKSVFLLLLLLLVFPSSIWIDCAVAVEEEDDYLDNMLMGGFLLGAPM